MSEQEKKPCENKHCKHYCLPCEKCLKNKNEYELCKMSGFQFYTPRGESGN